MGYIFTKAERFAILKAPQHIERFIPSSHRAARSNTSDCERQLESAVATEKALLL
jgi:hypothetical protein